MNPLSKLETIGIFAAVAIMAVSLAVIRFNSDTFTLGEVAETQLATVIATSDDDNNEELRETLSDSVGLDGELKKLVIDDVRVGSGSEVKSGDTVTVHYKGTLRDGTKFDDSTVRGTPFTFTVGEGMVIAGWEEGILGMKKGGERILVVPPEMAYGNRQVGPIPANSPLIFSIELLEIE
jgi:FKBP-type peptidyl-prolyl cis-trans isomerase